MQQHLKKKIVFFLLFTFNFATITFGQITKVEVGINGLTCSQCSRSVEMQMKKLDFIHKMQMDLKDTKLEVNLDTLKKIDWYAFPIAIKNAGFSIRNLILKLDEVSLNPSKPYFIFQNTYFYILDYNDESKLNGNYMVIGDSFMPRRTFSIYKIPKLPELKSKKLIFLKAIQ